MNTASSDDDAENSSATTSGTVSASSSLRINNYSSNDRRTSSFIHAATTPARSNTALLTQRDAVVTDPMASGTQKSASDGGDLPIDLLRQTAAALARTQRTEPPTSPPPSLPSSSPSLEKSTISLAKNKEMSERAVDSLYQIPLSSHNHQSSQSAAAAFAALISTAKPPSPPTAPPPSLSEAAELAIFRSNYSSSASTRPLLLQREAPRATSSLIVRSSFCADKTAPALSEESASAKITRHVSASATSVSPAKGRNVENIVSVCDNLLVAKQNSSTSELPITANISPLSSSKAAAGEANDRRPSPPQQHSLSDAVMRQCRVTLPSTTSTNEHDNDDGNEINDNDCAENNAAATVAVRTSSLYAEYANQQIVRSNVLMSSGASVLANRPLSSSTFSTARVAPSSSCAATPTPTSTSVANNRDAEIAHPRVSTKIQELLRTLKKPKRKPLEEYYEDDEDEDFSGTRTDKNCVFMRHVCNLHLK